MSMPFTPSASQERSPPELLEAVIDRGSQDVAALVHEVGAAGAWEPNQLLKLMSIDAEQVRKLVHSNGWHGLPPAEMLARVLSAV